MVARTLTLDLPFDLDPDEARLLFAIKLFEDARVSLGYAAGMAGYSTRAFVEILARRGIQAFSITEEDLANDLQTLADLDMLDAPAEVAPPG
jgi:predicted HTH domain antitoxin